MDAAKNFAKVTLSTGYSSAATTVVLNSGDGLKLPAAPFNATWWNFTDFPDPSDDPNVEIVRVTAIATDTLTITRAQEATAAANHNTAGKTYKMIAGLTAKVMNADVVPYSGAAADVLLGANRLQSSGIFPLADSTTAIRIFKADGVTPVATIDTSNSNLALGVSAAASGILRLPNSQAIVARNNANNGDVTVFSVNSGNQIVVGAVARFVAGFTLTDNQSATSGANKNGPIGSIVSNYWTGAASANDIWNIQDVLGAGTNPTSVLTFSHSGSSGAATVSLPDITVTTINGNTLTAGSSVFTGTAGQTYTFPGATDGIVGQNSAQTLQNKRIRKRLSALSANSATPSINTDTTDVVHITNQTAAITSFTTGLSGTPGDSDSLRISVTGTGAVALTFGASFEASTLALPTTTVGTARLDMEFFWNTETSKWRIMAVA
jgi:hypothetical protein